MGNVSDHLANVALCQQECAARTGEYMREGQIQASKALAFDRRVEPPREQLPPGWRPSKGAGKGGPPPGMRGPPGRQSPQGSWQPQTPENPMREYRPQGEQQAMSSRRNGFGSQGPDGPNWKSRDGFVTNNQEDEMNSSFSPWAPRGLYAKVQGDQEEGGASRQVSGVSGPNRQASVASGGGSCGSRSAVSRRRSSKDLSQEGPKVEDTQIGTGISEFLKRGVAQAAKKPAKERPEMLPSKDGGFIATIQQGFQGIFGHLATSKEEVLKMRGPMSAPEYEAVPGDDIDQRVQFYARQIPQHLGECLKIYRKAKGEYEVSDEIVRMAWQSNLSPPTPQSPQGQIMREVFVFIESAAQQSEGGQMPSEPLPFYLRHSANVAYDLQFGSAMTKVPECSRLSFAEETGTLLKDSDADSKYKAMLLASEQAQKREVAAMEFRRKMDDEEEENDSQVGRQSSVADDQRYPGPGRANSQLLIPQREASCSPRKEEAQRGRENTWRNRSYSPPPKEFASPLPAAKQRAPSLDSYEAMHVEGGLPPLPPLIPPPLAGPGGSFLLPPGAEHNGNSFLMPPGAGYQGLNLGGLGGGGSGNLFGGVRQSSGATPSTGFGSSLPASSTHGGSFFSSGLGPTGGSFYNAGLGPHGGSFVNSGGGSFLMTPGMQPSGGGLPRTGSGVQVGIPQQQPMFPFVR
eukprot:TRINITY_DN36516_c0_g1_i1.p1 TRINITY_DN36516_c0_g1~~TRINITY_DN36516_c0_g1_i1.p1  ORF type:complete len:704 (-),score=125.30 TRINITY_DN36516_c0_g1_i1:81-2141(-)